MKSTILLRYAATATLTVLTLAGCGGHKTTSTTNTTSTKDASMGQSTAGAMAPTTTGAMNASALDCGAVKPVWVNMKSKAYHEPGDPYYGKTKNGKYMCPRAAQAAGYHAAGMHNGSESSMNGGSMMNPKRGRHHGSMQNQMTPEPAAT